MDVRNFEEKRFDSFLNKTIIYSSKDFYRKQMTISRNEKSLINDEEEDIYSDVIDNATLVAIDNKDNNIDDVLDLQFAFSTLSAIEQAVIFWIFEMDLTQSDVAKILKIYTRSVRRIEYRALEKIKNILEGDI